MYIAEPESPLSQSATSTGQDITANRQTLVISIGDGSAALLNAYRLDIAISIQKKHDGAEGEIIVGFT